MQPFSVGPSPNAACDFHRTALSSGSGRSPVSRPARMDGRMTGATDNQSFPAAGSHDLHPRRFLGPPFDPQVGELADVVDLAVVPRSAEFTGIRPESLKQRAAAIRDDLGREVGEDGVGQSSSAAVSDDP